MTAAPQSPLVEKQCSKCKESKPLDEFHLCRTGTQGRAAWCKACYRLYEVGRQVERKAEREARRMAKEARRAQLATRVKP